MKKIYIILMMLLSFNIVTKAQEYVDIMFNENQGSVYTLRFTVIEGDGIYNECSVKAQKPPTKETAALEIPTKVSINGSEYYVTQIDSIAFRRATKFSSVVLPDSLKIIRGSAFLNCTGLTGDLVIPNNVTYIGQEAFKGCTNLKGTLTLSENLKTIASSAFYNCSGFTGNLVIPNSVTTIGSSAFYGCSGFKGSLTLSQNITAINNYTFYSCTGFTGKLTIPNSVTSIGSYAFYDCRYFSGSLTLSENLKTIGTYAFAASSLSSSYSMGFTGDLVIPNSVTTIGNNAFYNCRDFSGSLILSESLETIGSYAFASSSSYSMGFTGDLVIPNSVTTIGNNAFYNCRGFKGSLILSENLTSIGSYAFSTSSSSMGFTGSLTIPEKITSISDYAFQYCSNFDGTLTLPASLKSIGAYSFANCSNFVEMVSLATTPPSAKSTSFSGNNIAILYVPAESIDAYYEVSPWYDFWIMELVQFDELELEVTDDNGELLYTLIFNTTEDFTGVSVRLGQEPTSEVGLIIPETAWDAYQNFTYNVVEIADNAFKDCTYFTSVELPITIRNIGENAFSGCSNIEKIVSLRPTPPATGDNCFDGIPDNTALLVPANSINNYDILPWNRFDITPMLVDYEYIVRDENGSFLYSLLFNLNDDYSTLRVKIKTKPTSTYKPALNIPENFLGFPVTVIEDYAFNNCTYFSSLTLPNSITHIGKYAFASSSNSSMYFAGELVIPNSVTYIDDYAFKNCTYFTSLKFEENSKLEHIGKYAFSGYINYNAYTMNFAGELSIPNSVTYIDDYAFYLCDDFTSLKFEENSKLEHIGKYAFAGYCFFTDYDYDYNYDGVIDAYDYYLYDNSMKFAGNLNIPSSVTSIGDYAFYLCDDFTGISFGQNSKLDSIGDYAFAGYTDYNYHYDYNYNKESKAEIILPMNFAGDLSIPGSVTSIGKYAFRNCNFTGDIIIGDNQETSKSLTIEQYSFSDCSAAGLKLGKSVTSISDYAFAGTSESKSEWGDNFSRDQDIVTTRDFSGELVIPNSVTSIGNYAFYLCDKFSSIKFEENSKLETIGEYAFAGTVARDCYWDNNNSNNNYEDYTPYAMGFIGDLEIPGSVTSIGSHAFYLCNNLTGLKFEANSKLQTIGEYAFGGHSDWNGNAFNMGFEGELVIPNSVTSIGNYAFYLCNNFYKLKFEEGSKLQTIGAHAFSGYSWNGVIPMAFTGELEIPNSVTTIGDYAFQFCQDFTSLKFEENSKLESIGHGAFSGGGYNQMNFADSLVLPANLTSIGNYAFEFNKNLATVTSLATVAPTLGNGAFNNISSSTKTLHIPEGSILSYIEKGWFNYFSMPEATTLSGKCGDNLTWEVNTGDGILKIQGTGDMYDYSNNIAPWRNVSTSLKELILEDGITSVGNYAFYKCDSIRGELNIPNSVTSIGDNAFDHCTGFTGKLTIPNSVTSIGNYAFYYCRYFTGLTFEENSKLETIGNSAFSGCYGFKGDLIIPNTVTSIGSSAFNACSGFTGDLIIPNSVTSIGSSAFSNCDFDGTLTLPKNLTAINNWTFSSCNFTGELNIPDGVTFIGISAFGSCNFTGELNIPDGVTFIGNSAFDVCSFSGTLYIPGSLTHIESSAFDGEDFDKIVSLGETPADCNGEWEEYNYETNEYEWFSGPMPIFGTDLNNIPQIYVPASAVRKYNTAWSYYKDFIYTDGLPTFIKNGGGDVTTNWHILEGGSRKYRLPNADEDVIINASLTIQDGKTLSVGSIATGSNGNLTLKEGGQLFCDNIYSDIKVEKSIEAHSTTGNTTWTTISSPFGKDTNPSSVANLTSGSYSLYRYDEPSAVWQNYKNSANNGFTTFEAGRGYIYSNSNDVTLSFEGTSNTSNINYELTKESEKLSGFHLIGNPYTHNITFDNFETATSEGISDTLVITLSGNSYWGSYNYLKIVSDDGSINEKYTSRTTYELAGVSGKHLTISYIRDSYSYGLYVTVKYKNGETIINNMNMYSSSYGTFKLASFMAATPKDILAEGYYSLSNEGAWGVKYGEETEIKPCQGILVKASEEGYLSIKSTVAQTRGAKRDRNVSDVLAISVTNSKYDDKAYISFNDGIGLDKIAHENKNIPMIYIPGKEADYAVAMMDKNFEEIPVNFEAGVMGEYTISVAQKDCGFSKLYLYDKVENRTVNILKNDYTFFATTSDDPDRFIIKAVNDVVLENFAYINNGNLIIGNINGDATINVYDVLGRSVLQCNCNDDEYSISTKSFTSGVYIIQKSDNNGVKTQKVVVE